MLFYAQAILEKLLSAERKGFEPLDPVTDQWFSRPPQSTPLPSLQYIIIEYSFSRPIRNIIKSMAFLSIS